MTDSKDGNDYFSDQQQPINAQSRQPQLNFKIFKAQTKNTIYSK